MQSQPTRGAPAGPAGDVAWEARTVGVIGVVGAVGGEVTRPTTVMRLPDAATPADGARLYYLLPRAPLLARDGCGNPLLALTLVTSRQPAPDEPALDAIIKQGRLELTLSLAVPPATLEALAALGDGDYQPLFARAVTLSVATSDNAVLASADGSGSDAQLALSVPLNREQALGVLAALDGAPSGLLARANVRYQVAATPHTVHLSGSAVAIYDDLLAHTAPDGTLTRAVLLARFESQLLTGTISATTSAADGSVTPLNGGDSQALFDAFMRVASFIVERVTPELALADANNRYTLRQRPNPLMTLNLTQTLTTAAEQTVEQRAPLEDVLGGALTGHDWSQFVHIIAPSGTSASGYAPAPRLYSAPRVRTRDGAERVTQLALAGNQVSSLALTMTPDTTAAPSAHALLASDVLTNAIAANWAAHDLVLVNEDDPRLQHLPLPVVADRAAPLWPDRVTSGAFWYAPTFEVVQPSANQDTASSPFLFTFTQTGVTAGPNPTPGLDGSVRFTLRQTPSQATVTALAARGNPTAQPVPLGGLSVTLQLPFRDQSSGETRAQSFPASVEQQGETLVATVELLDSWVRLCYGALAYPNFQTQPASLSVAYAFRAYVPFDDTDVQWTYGGKISLVQLAATKLDLPQKIERPTFNAADLTMHVPNGELRYAPEAPRQRAAPVRPLASSAVATVAVASTQAVMLAQPVAQNSVLVARPELELAPALLARINKIRYGMQTIVHEEAPAALYPCATCGAFYVQTTADSQTAIGCQDALRLGEISYRQYDELTDLRDNLYRVYRSLQQPGRYLVVPATYRISRYGASEAAERAYRPIVLVYATLDPDPAQNRYFFRATLQADIPYFTRKELEDRLVPYTPFGHLPQLDYPTEPFVQATTSYRWSLPSGIAEPDVQQLWDGFQVGVSTDLTNAALVMTLLDNDGLNGQATFTLPDGLTLQANLVLDSHIVGPWDKGPIAVEVAAGTATLTNRVEQSVNVFETLTRDASGPPTHTPVNATLAPAGVAQATVSGPTDDVYASYAVVPQQLTLQELDIFAEDVVSNVLFVNLINYANHALSQLQLSVRVTGTEHIYAVTIAEGQTATLTLTLPLTTYLANQAIQLQVTKTFTSDAQPATTAWIDWNLATQGISISLTWELIQ